MAPQKKPPSKTLIVVRLLVALGAVMVAGVVTIVALLNQPEEKEVDVPNTATSPDSGTRTNTGQQRPAGNSRAEPSKTDISDADWKKFIISLGTWRSGIDRSITNLESAEKAMESEFNDRRDQAENEAQRIEAEVQEHEISLADLRAKADEADSLTQAAQKIYDSVLAEQSTTSRFLRALAEYYAAIHATDKAEAELSLATIALDAAADAYAEAREDYYQADGSGDEGKKLEIAEAAAEAVRTARKVEAQRTSDYQEAKRAEEVAYINATTIESELLKSSDANAKKLVDAFSTYRKSLNSLSEVGHRIDELNAELVPMKSEIDRLDAEAVKLGDEYRRVHAVYRDLRSKASKLASQYKTSGGEARKAAAIRAQQAADDYAPTDKKAKDAKNTAEKALSNAKAERRKHESKIAAAKAELATLLEGDAKERVKLDKVVDEVRKAEEPKEMTRMESLKRAEKKLNEAKASLKSLMERVAKLADDRNAKDRQAQQLRATAVKYGSLSASSVGSATSKHRVLSELLKKFESRTALSTTELDLLLRAANQAVDSLSAYDANGDVRSLARSDAKVRSLLEVKDVAAIDAAEQASLVAWGVYEISQRLGK
jgi:DNA repair exonuclease SbcCD ATPase subunit